MILQSKNGKGWGRFGIITALMIIFLIALLSCVEEPDDLMPWQHSDEWTRISASGGQVGPCVYSIMEDRNGNMWFGTNNGVTRLSENGTLTRFGQQEGILGTHVYAIIEAADGTFYMGTNQGFTISSGETVSNIETLLDTKFEVLDIIQDSRKNIWLATDLFGAIFLSAEDGELYQPNYSECPGCYYANSVFEDSKNNIWIGSMGGALKYDYNSLKIYSAANGLSSNAVQSIAEDRWGDIWIGPRGGKDLGRFNGSSIELVTMLTDYDTDYVMDIMLDKSGDLWFGLVSAGAVKYNGSFMRQYVESDGLTDPSVMSLYTDSKGNIWLGSLSSGVFKFSPGIKSKHE
ncbi:MAG: two-component regulator propeller domain-containing protein [Bacteroidales bacterium]